MYPICHADIQVVRYGWIQYSCSILQTTGTLCSRILSRFQFLLTTIKSWSVQHDLSHLTLVRRQLWRFSNSSDAEGNNLCKYTLEIAHYYNINRIENCIDILEIFNKRRVDSQTENRVAHCMRACVTCTFSSVFNMQECTHPRASGNRRNETGGDI